MKQANHSLIGWLPRINAHVKYMTTLDISLQNQHQMALLGMCINVFACIYTYIYYMNII